MKILNLDQNWVLKKYVPVHTYLRAQAHFNLISPKLKQSRAEITMDLDCAIDKDRPPTNFKFLNSINAIYRTLPAHKKSGQLPLFSAYDKFPNFPPSQLPVGEREKKQTWAKRMTESQGNSEKMSKQKRERSLLAVSGAAALLVLAVNLGINAFNSHRKNRKNKGLFITYLIFFSL